MNLKSKSISEIRSTIILLAAKLENVEDAQISERIEALNYLLGDLLTEQGGKGVPTEQEIKQMADLIANKIHGDYPTQIKVHYKVGIIEGAEWAISQMQPEWVQITKKSDLPEKSCVMWVFDKPSQKVMSASFNNTIEACNYWLANASHYMLIEQPQPPTK